MEYGDAFDTEKFNWEHVLVTLKDEHLLRDRIVGSLWWCDIHNIKYETDFLFYKTTTAADKEW